MTSPNAELIVKHWLATYQHLFKQEDGPSTAVALLAEYPHDTLPCSLLDQAGKRGAIPEPTCSDLFRLNPYLRERCGCSPLPTTMPLGMENPFVPLGES